MKKFLSVFLSFVFVVGVCISAPITVNAANVNTVGNWEIQLEGNSSTCSIIRFTDSEATTVEVPASFMIDEIEYAVTDIPSNPFLDCDKLDAISVADGSVFSVADGVLYNNAGTVLVSYPNAKEGESFIIPETVTVVGAEALNGAAKLKYVFYNGAESALSGEEMLSELVFHYEATDHTKSSTTKLVSAATCKEGEVTAYYCTVIGCDKILETVTSEEVDPNAHDEGRWEQTVAPTCNDKGVTARKCTRCGTELETDEIDVLAHDLGGWVLDSAPTCVDEGTMHRACKNNGCDYKEEAKISATGVHAPGEWEVLTEPTCDEDGVKVKKCTICEAECETGVITAQHTLGEWKTTKEPTCKEEGTRERKCTVENCEYKETEAIEKLSHTENGWIFVEDSTCSKEGKLEKKCTVCKEVIETAIVPKKDHNFSEWSETKAPTCTEEGSKERKCKDCSETETEAVSVLGHDFSEDFTVDTEPTCTEAGSKSKHCSRCEEKTEVTEISSLGHDYENVDFTIDLAPTCTEAGSKSKHCTRCEEKTEITEIPATGHIDFVYETIKEATCTTAGSMLKKCKCGEELETIVTSPKEHVLSDWITDKEATCTTAGSKHKECTLCHAVIESGVIEIAGHKFGEWIITEEATCEKDGSKYRICSVCEEKETEIIEKIAHKNATVKDAKDATCLEDGYSGDRYCPDCKTTIEKGEVIKATGHTPSEWITDKAATFTENGSQHKECTVCKVELEKAIIEKLTLSTPVVKVENVSNGIKVSWTQDEDAASYTIYRATYNKTTGKWSSWSARTTTKADKNSWVDTKITKDVLYRYTVRAVNGKYKSGYTATSTIVFITAPKVSVSITTTGNLAKWNKIKTADSYTVYRAEIKDGKWSKWTILGTTVAAKN